MSQNVNEPLDKYPNIIIQPELFPDRDQRPQRDAWAPGTYENICTDCNNKFMGDKRACQCAECAYKDA